LITYCRRGDLIRCRRDEQLVVRVESDFKESELSGGIDGTVVSGVSFSGGLGTRISNWNPYAFELVGNEAHQLAVELRLIDEGEEV